VSGSEQSGSKHVFANFGKIKLQIYNIKHTRDLVQKSATVARCNTSIDNYV